MAEPTFKTREINDFLDSLNPNGLKREDSIRSGVCTWCGGEIIGFDDELSEREYCISGMCQKCQDETFAED